MTRRTDQLKQKTAAAAAAAAVVATFEMSDTESEGEPPRSRVPRRSQRIQEQAIQQAKRSATAACESFATEPNVKADASPPARKRVKRSTRQDARGEDGSDDASPEPVSTLAVVPAPTPLLPIDLYGQLLDVVARRDEIHRRDQEASYQRDLAHQQERQETLVEIRASQERTFRFLAELHERSAPSIRELVDVVVSNGGGAIPK